MAIRIFDEERMEQLNNLKLVITVYPTENDWIAHWYFDSNGVSSDEFNLQELYAILSSIPDVEQSVERLFTLLHNSKIKGDDPELYDEDDDDE